jgi:ribose/xylose/arabinose/galactoside ABC-type transport system permease subunit
MRPNLSAQEFHARYCPVKNPKSALFLVVYFSVAAFGNWKALHKAPEHLDLVTLSFVIIVLAMLARSLVNFTCFRERLVFGLVIVGLVTGEVYGFFPAIVGPYAYVVKFGKLTLSLLGLLVSLTMLVQSARSPNVGPSNAEASIAWQSKQNFPILLVVVLTVLLLGALLYFLPFRQ